MVKDYYDVGGLYESPDADMYCQLQQGLSGVFRPDRKKLGPARMFSWLLILIEEIGMV